MFFVWKGWGILVPVQWVAVLVVSQSIIDRVFGPGYYTSNAWASSLALALSAISIYFVGKHLNRPIPWDHPVPGKDSVWPAQHTFFWLPYQHWAWVTVALGLYMSLAS